MLQVLVAAILSSIVRIECNDDFLRGVELLVELGRNVCSTEGGSSLNVKSLL